MALQPRSRSFLGHAHPASTAPEPDCTQMWEERGSGEVDLRRRRGAERVDCLHPRRPSAITDCISGVWEEGARRARLHCRRRSGCRPHLSPHSPRGRAPPPQIPVSKTPAQPPALQQSPQSDPRSQQASADPTRPPPTSPACGHVSTLASPVAVQGADHRAAGAPWPLPRIHSALKHASRSRANCFRFHNQDFSWGSLWPPSHRHSLG